MTVYILKRLLYMIPTVFVISVLTFVVVNLPPGDFVDRLVSEREQMGEVISPEEEAAIRASYGLDKSLPQQYFRWLTDIVTRGDFGFSYAWQLPVSDLIWMRLSMTFMISLSSMFFIWAVAIPIGVYSAVRQYSAGDYIFTFIGFIGLAVPNFLLALVLLYISFKFFDQSVGGLFSPEFVDAPWSWARVRDFLSHLWIPMVVLGTAGTAGLIRTLRANLLDELKRPYVVTARTKGLPELWLLIKYPLRHALNPFVSSLNDIFVSLVSGATIVSIVLSLQTVGPLLLEAVRQEDMFLAGSAILLLSVLAVFGTLVSDILLAWLDPRIRFQ